ncbi:hypothetical protein NPIL_679861 [Nephila pilipes]|uniref:Uncharacterized protein n=1 Tax=Nephila pilipes TaxID=299642 RepID=A0A8X6Q2T3_NEPPI|nr:hypothetical protein NPIL_679861 [Nephila pilipes]
MHHHPRNQERAINLSILAVSGPAYAIGAGVTAAAGTRLALQSFLSNTLYLAIIPITGSRKSPVSLFFVTTSPSREWGRASPEGDGSQLESRWRSETHPYRADPTGSTIAARPTATRGSRRRPQLQRQVGTTPRERGLRCGRVRTLDDRVPSRRVCTPTRCERNEPPNGDSTRNESARSTTGFLYGARARRPDARGASPRTGTRRGTSRVGLGGFLYVPRTRHDPPSSTARVMETEVLGRCFNGRRPTRCLRTPEPVLSSVFGPVFGPGGPPVPFHAPGHSAEVPGPAVFGRARPSFIRSGRTPRAAGGPRPLPPTLQCFGSSARTPIRTRALGKNPRLLLSQSFLPPVPRDPAGRRIAPASPAHSLVLRIVSYKHRSGRGRWATPATPSEPILPSSGPYGPRGPPDQTGRSRPLSSASDRQLEQPIRPRALGNTRDSSFVVPSTLRSPRTPRAAGSPRQLRPSPDGATSPSVRSPDAPSLYESAGEPPPPASRLARPAAAPPPLDRGAPEAREQPGGTSHRI